jgi:hypothetical protein
MDAQDSWKEAKTKMWARVKEIEKDVPSYDYSEQHHMMATDERIKDLMLSELRKSKKALFSVLDVSYEQQKEGLTKELQKIRDDLDIFLDHVKIKRQIKWPERMPQEFLEKIVVHDSEILRRIPSLNSCIHEIQKQVLSMEKPGTSLFDREEMDNLNKRTKDVKRQVDDLVTLFRERELLLNLKHIHREHEYDELRGTI